MRKTMRNLIVALLCLPMLLTSCIDITQEEQLMRAEAVTNRVEEKAQAGNRTASQPKPNTEAAGSVSGNTIESADAVEGIATDKTAKTDEHETAKTGEPDCTTEPASPAEAKASRPVFNTDVRTYLFMGIDKGSVEGSSGPVGVNEDQISGGQADSLFLFCVDSRNKKLSLVPVNRNSMMDVDVYDEEGTYVGTAPLQICLQHGYGDGGKVSCERTVDAISRYFYDIPIDGYAAIDMDAMIAIIDQLGGVTFTPSKSVPAGRGCDAIEGGVKTTLDGAQALWYMRYRNREKMNSVSERMEREQEIFDVLVKMAREKYKENVVLVFEAVTKAMEYTTTNLTLKEAHSLVMDCYDYRDNTKIYHLPGETKIGETKLEEFTIDDDAVYEMTMEIFFKQS